MKDTGNVPKSTVRSSISFSQSIYTSLEEIALEKRVSLAWVVRDAVETYLIRTKRRKKCQKSMKKI
jgi:metal-responsive CopG/Arc/MetJ family transcriptional regulator